MIIGCTGYRPDKLPDKETGYSLPNSTYLKVCRETEKIFRELKPEKIITGMALGFDQYVAFIAHKLKIPFLAAIPFQDQEIKWSKNSKEIYYKLLSLAKEQVIVSPGEYSIEKMQVRNKFIVDNCDVLLACINENETSGGTFNCVKYARSVGREIIFIRPT